METGSSECSPDRSQGEVDSLDHFEEELMRLANRLNIKMQNTEGGVVTPRFSAGLSRIMEVLLQVREERKS